MMTEGKAHAAYGTKEYPSHPVKVSYGMALVASEDLPAGTVVEKLEGPPVDYESLSDYDKTYALTYQAKGSDEWTWLLPVTNARFANHSCDPTAYIDSATQELVLRRDVRKGEQITFLYNPQGDVEEPWDPIWTFTCHCGSENCQTEIDAYRPSSLENPPRQTGADRREE